MDKRKSLALMVERAIRLSALNTAALREFAVFTHVCTDAKPRVNELGRYFGIPAPSIVRAVDNLERHGLVERRVDPTDGRCVQLLSTKLGLQTLDRILGQ